MLCEKCAPRELKAMRALESLTPSGSEFVNDVERCVAFVKSSQESQHRTIVNFSSRAKAAEERHERLKRNVKKLACDVECDDSKFFQYLETLTVDQTIDLAIVLRGELLQVVNAVEEAK